MTKPYIFIEEGEELKNLWKEYEATVREALAVIPGSDKDKDKMAKWLEIEGRQATVVHRIKEITGTEG